MARTQSAPAAGRDTASSRPAAAGARPPRQRRGLRQRVELTALLAPAIVLFIGFVIVPMIFAAWYSLYNWSGFGPLNDFIGVQNYTGVLTGPVFHQALLHNVIIAVLSLVIQLPISIGLALLLNRRVRGRTFLRLAVFAPFVLSEATAAVMWYELLQPGGPLDALLKAVGLGGLIHYWLASTSLVLYSVFVVATWKYIGFGIVLLLAGLQGVPPELREAAAIDGATPWQVTRAITLPLLGPTIRIWIFLSVIGSLQLFDLVLDHDPGRARERVEHHADLPVHQRCPAHGVRVRRHGLGGPVRHLAGLRAGLPALRAAPRHVRRADPGRHVSRKQVIR